MGNLAEETKKTYLTWKGPFLVKKIFRNSLQLECLITGQPIKRNISLCKKLFLNEEQEKILRNRNFIIKNNKFYKITEFTDERILISDIMETEQKFFTAE